jgi:hypothetical protein
VAGPWTPSPIFGPDPIILGLAIQQVLQGYRALILSRQRIRSYAPPLIWSVLILLMVAQNWWGSFGLAGRTEWSFALFATILVQTILLYMMAAIVLPDIPSDQTIDLRDHYYREARAFRHIRCPDPVEPAARIYSRAACFAVA